MATSSVSSTTPTTSTTSSASAPTMTAAQIADANKAAAQSLIDALGAGSGVNVNALATNLVAAEKTPLANAINAKISKNQARISGYSAISYVVSQVQTAFAALKDQSSYNTLTVANSNTSAFDVTASTSASTGTHDIEVVRLAKSQRSVSQGLSSASATLNGGNAMNLTLTTGKGVSAQISVVAGSDTPQGVVDAINASADAKTAGVTAQLVDTGDGSAAPLKIVLMGQQGAVNSFSISGIGNTSTGATPAVSTTQGDAQTTESSQVTFNDMSAGQTVTVGGLTYTATDTTTGAEVAAAFAGIQAGGTLPSGLTKGLFSGSLSGFNAGASTSGSAALTFTSTTPNADVTDISVAATQTIFSASEPTNQTAVDAQVKVDGITYTRTNNTLTDVVKGATINLKSPTPTGSPATIQLTRDNTAITTNINTLVSSYNDAISMLNVVSDPKSTVATYGATLVGDSTVRMVKQQLKSLFFGNSSTPGTSVSALWQMGISVDQTGVLTADSTKLTTALNGNYDDVVKTLTGNQNNVSAYGTTPAGIAGDAYRKLDKLLSATGPLLTQSSNATTQNSKYQDDLTKLNTRMDSLLARYQKQFATMNSLVGTVNSQKTSLKATFDGMMASYTGKTG